MAILVGQFLFKFTSGKDNKKKIQLTSGGHVQISYLTFIMHSHKYI